MCLWYTGGTALYIFTFITFYFLIKISFIQHVDLRHFKISLYSVEMKDERYISIYRFR